LRPKTQSELYYQRDNHKFQSSPQNEASYKEIPSIKSVFNIDSFDTQQTNEQSPSSKTSLGKKEGRKRREERMQTKILESFQNIGLKEVTLERARNKDKAAEPRFTLKLREIGMEQSIKEENESSSNESEETLQDSETSSQEENEEEDDGMNQSELFPIGSEIPDFEDSTKIEEIMQYLNVRFKYNIIYLNS